MRIAVTGGAGFIGSHVINYAKEIGHEAWALDHSYGMTIMDRDDLDEGLDGADAVIHLAGMLGTSELFDLAYAAVDINVKGALNVLNWCRDNGAAYVGITMPDSHWANVYQATKLCAMRLATAWHRNYGVPVSHVRAFNVYGPGQKHGPGHPQKFLPTFATHAWAKLKVPVFGSGLQTIDPVWVGDVARMLVEATGFGDDEIFDGGTGTDMTVRSFARLINRITGNDLENIEYLPMRPGEEPDSTIKAKGEGWDKLGWRPELDPARLEEAVNWYKP